MSRPMMPPLSQGPYSPKGIYRESRGALPQAQRSLQGQGKEARVALSVTRTDGSLFGAGLKWFEFLRRC